MRGVPPSERIHQQIGDVLENRLEGVDSPLGVLVRLSAEWVAQEAWEKEKAGRHERGYWNGRKSGRLRTAEREIVVQVTWLRDWAEEGLCRSRLMGFLRGNSNALEKLAVEMYARGLSIRDIGSAPDI